MGAKFKIGDKVTRSTKHPSRKDFKDLTGTVVEIFTYNHINRYKIKWDKKSGKWIPNLSFGKFVADVGQQRSTLQAKFLTKVLS